MTTETDDEDEESDDLNDLAEYGVDSAIISDQKWEDFLAILKIKEKNPELPHILKVVRYTPANLLEQKEWLAENCRAYFKQLGWHSACSYTVAIGFVSHVDAILYRLRWH